MESIKAIVMAPSGYGKTGALASLLSAGYNLYVLDFDNGIRSLRENTKRDCYAKDSLSRLHWATITEPMRISGGKIVPAKATVWPRAVALLEHWKWEDPEQGGEVDFGKPSEWGDKDVLVVDTLSKASVAALNYHLAMNGRLGGTQTGNEYRRDIGAAQGFIDTLMQFLFDSSIKCNVIINTHVVYSKEDGTMPAQDEQGAMLFGFPKAIGRAAGPNIPTYFNDILMLRKQGSTSKLCTRNQVQFGLKSCAPMRVKAEYPLESGLADYFADVRKGEPESASTSTTASA